MGDDANADSLYRRASMAFSERPKLRSEGCDMRSSTFVCSGLQRLVAAISARLISIPQFPIFGEDTVLTTDLYGLVTV